MEQTKNYGRNTLFNFIHITEPKELLDPQTRTYFIEKPINNASAFAEILNNNYSQDIKEGKLKTILESFNPIESYKEVETLSPTLYKFALWLDANKGKFDFESIMANTANITLLTGDQFKIIWDQLLYQSITTASKTISQAILIVLRASRFLKALEDYTNATEFSDADLKHLTRVANTIVIIPSKLVTKTKEETEPNPDFIDANTKKYLNNIIEADITRFKIEKLEKLKEQLGIAYQDLLILNDENLKGAYKSYLETYADEIAAAQANNQKPDIPAFVAPEFSQFNDDFIKEKIGDELYLYYKSLNESTTCDYDLFLKTIEKTINKLVENIAITNNEDKTIIAFKKIEINYSEAPQVETAILKSVTMPHGTEVFLTQYFTDANNKIEITNTALKVDGTLANNNQSKKISESSKHVTYKLLDSALDLVNIQGEISIETDYNTAILAKGAQYKQEPYDPNASPIWRLPEVVSYHDGMPGNNIVKLFGVNKIGIAEYKRVEQEICCYVPGEVSHIENVMAREYKEKMTRLLNRTEITSEETSEREVENLNDTTSTERFELQSEINNVLQEDQAITANATVGYTNGGFNASVNGSYSNNSSSTSTRNNSETYAKDLTERALKRVVDKTSMKRTSRMLKELEETDKHGFDNRAGDKHVTGIYRWVDKIYKNELVNYGKRLIYEFMVPEPSKNFKYWMTKKSDINSSSVALTKPKHPRDCWWPIRYASDLNKSNYSSVAAYYGAEVDICPDEFKRIGKSFGDTPGKSGFEVKDRIDGGYGLELKIPEGYFCSRVRYTYGQVYSGQDNNHTQGHIAIGNGQQNVLNSDTHSANDAVVDVEGLLPISISVHDVGAFNLNIFADCDRKTEYYQAWQATTFLKIMEAYDKKVQKYEDDLASYKNANPTQAEAIDYNFNPIIARSIEMREIKRICIEMITSPFGFNMGRNNYMLDTNAHKVILNAAYENYANHVKFLEEAFDWELMAYLLYPYYWADQSDWSTLIKESSSADYIFQAFLQSGMSKVSIPVRPGYEHRVLYYLDTGIVWIDKGYLLDNPNDIYSSIDRELEVKQPDEDGYVEATWETRVPSSLTIIQSDSAPLQENGLPCMCEDGTAIATGNNLMYSTSQNENNNFEKITAKYTELNNAFLDALNTYNTSATPSAICASTLDTIRTLSSVLSALTAQAMLVGYDTALFITTLTSMQAEISRISALCV